MLYWHAPLWSPSGSTNGGRCCKDMTDTPTIPAGETSPPATTYLGLQESAVQDLHDAVQRIAQKQVDGLRRLERDAAGRLRAAALEQQQLERFLDELGYRARFLAEQQAR